MKKFEVIWFNYIILTKKFLNYFKYFYLNRILKLSNKRYLRVDKFIKKNVSSFFFYFWKIYKLKINENFIKIF